MPLLPGPGHDLVLIAATVEDDAYGEALLVAAGADEQMLVRLEASAPTLKRRLVGREPEGWSGLAELLESSRHLAERMVTLAGVDLVLSTEDQRPEHVAARLHAALRERVHAGRRSRDR